MPDELHMNPEEFRDLGRKLLDYIADYRERVGSFPVLSRVGPGEVAAKLPKEPPACGDSLEGILEDIDEIVMPGITHWQSQGAQVSDRVAELVKEARKAQA